MIDVAFETLNSIGLRVLEELGFNPISPQPYPLETIVKATVEVVDILDEYDISALVVAGDAFTVVAEGSFRADVYATQAWAEWFSGNARRLFAALAVIAHLSEMIA